MSKKIEKSIDEAIVPIHKIRKIIKAAIHAPTPDNCQPYSFQWKNNKLKIYHHPELTNFAPDPKRRFSVFGLGIVSEAIDIACSAENLNPIFEYSIYAKESGPWCTITFKSATRKMNPLNSVIYKRCSDRREYVGGKLEGKNLEKFKSDGMSFKNTKLYFIEKCPENLKVFLHESYGLAFSWRKFRGDLLKMWYTSDRKAKKIRRGVTCRALNLPKVALIIARILHYTYGVGNAIFPVMYNSKPPIEYKDGAGLGCITVNTLDLEALIEAGRLCMRNWLRLSHIGFGYGPLGIVMHNYLMEENSIGSQIPKVYNKIIADGTHILRNVFNFPKNEIPLWMFRTGLVKEELPALARTYRSKVRNLSNLE